MFSLKVYGYIALHFDVDVLFSVVTADVQPSASGGDQAISGNEKTSASSIDLTLACLFVSQLNGR